MTERTREALGYLVERACLLAIVVACLVASGCTFTTRNHGTWALRFGTEIAVESRSAKTSQDPADDGGATVNTEFPSLESWLKEPEPEPEPVPVVVAPTG